MNEVLNFLSGSTFYIATVQDGAPKVRPFGFVMLYNDKLYFCTNDTKKVYAQLKENPMFEICACKDDEWLRLSANAVFDDSVEARDAAFAAAPFLRQIYGAPDSPVLRTFYADECSAAFYKMDGSIRTVQV